MRSGHSKGRTITGRGRTDVFEGLAEAGEAFQALLDDVGGPLADL